MGVERWAHFSTAGEAKGMRDAGEACVLMCLWVRTQFAMTWPLPRSAGRSSNGHNFLDRFSPVKCGQLTGDRFFQRLDIKQVRTIGRDGLGDLCFHLRRSDTYWAWTARFRTQPPSGAGQVAYLDTQSSPRYSRCFASC
jgi:hypothetical protein